MTNNRPDLPTVKHPCETRIEEAERKCDDTVSLAAIRSSEMEASLTAAVADLEQVRLDMKAESTRLEYEIEKITESANRHMVNLRMLGTQLLGKEPRGDSLDVCYAIGNRFAELEAELASERRRAISAEGGRDVARDILGDPDTDEGRAMETVARAIRGVMSPCSRLLGVNVSTEQHGDPDKGWYVVMARVMLERVSVAQVVEDLTGNVCEHDGRPCSEESKPMRENDVDTLGKRHSLRWSGECADWCRACRDNMRNGLNPDGTRPDAADNASKTCGGCGQCTVYTASNNHQDTYCDDQRARPPWGVGLNVEADQPPPRWCPGATPARTTSPCCWLTIDGDQSGCSPSCRRPPKSRVPRCEGCPGHHAECTTDACLARPRALSSSCPVWRTGTAPVMPVTDDTGDEDE